MCHPAQASRFRRQAVFQQAFNINQHRANRAVVGMPEQGGIYPTRIHQNGVGRNAKSIPINLAKPDITLVNLF